MSESSTYNSVIYKCNQDLKESIFFSNSFISSFDIYKDKLCISESTFKSYNLIVRDSVEMSKYYYSSKPIQEVMFADDSTIIFNHGQNGIVNSKMLSINRKDVKPLTNFRFNIKHNKFNKTRFIEVIDKGDKLEFFSVTKQPVNQYYTYDYIPNSYFETIDLTLKDEEIKPKQNINNQNSL